MTVTLTDGGTDERAVPVQPRIGSTNGGADPPPFAVAMPWNGDAWALVLPPGADLASLANAVRRLPTGCRFVEAHGDVETVLVFRFADQERTSHVPTEGGAEPAGAPTDQALEYHRIVEELTAEVEKGLRAIAALGYTLDGGMVP